MKKQYLSSYCAMELNEDQINFLIEVTGKDTPEKAFEEFTVVCATYFIEPEQIENFLKNVSFNPISWAGE